MVVKKSMSMVKNDGIVEETIVLEIPIFQVFTEWYSMISVGKFTTLASALPLAPHCIHGTDVPN